MLKAKNIDKVEKLFVSQPLLLLPFASTEVKYKKAQWISQDYSRSQQQTDLGHLIVEILSQMTRLFTSSL